MRPAWRLNYLRYKRLFIDYVGKYKERQDLKMFLEVLLSLLTISLFSLFALRPTIVTIAELIKEIEAKRETLAIMEEKVNNLTAAQRLYDQERSRIELLTTSIPEEPLPQRLVRQIEGLSAKHTVAILGMSVKETPLMPLPKKEQSDVVFSLNTTANYSSLVTFLEDLEKTRRPIKIVSLGLGTTVIDVGKVLNLTVTGQTPFFVEQNQIE